MLNDESGVADNGGLDEDASAVTACLAWIASFVGACITGGDDANVVDGILSLASASGQCEGGGWW